MDKQITRNAEEQEAFEALVHALSRSDRAALYVMAVEHAQYIERALLARGYVITKIEEINGLRDFADEVNAEGFYD